MTKLDGTDAPGDTGASGDDVVEPGAVPSPAAGRLEGGVVGELLLTVEVSALCAFAFSRPVLDSFGRSPETFVARGADAATVVLFGVVVALAPVVIVGLVGLAARALGARARWRVHLGLIAAVGGLALWRLGQDVTGWPGSATKLVVAGLLGGLLLALLRARLPGSRTFLRYAGAASLIFLAQFLFTSPASSLIRGGGAPELDDDVTRTVGAALGDDPPPIVFVITDTFPTQALMDGSGNIDAELYPNLAALASTSTWYRNSTTVSGFTNEAVPAMLSGLYPKPSTHQQFVVPYPNNLFTLLGGAYDLNVHEPMTRLCPEDLCETSSAGLGALVGDASDLWWGAAESETAKLDVPGLFKPDRYDDLERWIDDQDFRQEGRPDLFFYHAMLPHEPWDFLPDGTVYEASDPPAGVFTVGWSQNGTAVGHQRLVLQAQATDRLLGRLFDRMRDAGSFDDALIVVAGDHGQAFAEGEPWRAVSEENYDQVLWAPLIVKAPGQTEGEVDDSNVETIDVLPTVADRLGFDLPWPTDGIVAGGDERRAPDVKVFDDVDANELRAVDGQPRVEVDARPGLEALLRADAAEGTGADAAWERTAHGDLVGRAVDDLDLGPDAGASLGLLGLDQFDDVDLDRPLPLEVIGYTDEPGGTVIAYALNGTVAAVTQAAAPTQLGQQVQALLLPRTFAAGDNDMTAYLVEGPVGDETLRPLDVLDLG